MIYLQRLGSRVAPCSIVYQSCSEADGSRLAVIRSPSHLLLVVLDLGVLAGVRSGRLVILGLLLGLDVLLEEGEHLCQKQQYQNH